MIDVNSELFDILTTDGGEILDPEVWVSELWNQLFWETELSHDLVLIFVVGILGDRRELRGVAVGFEFVVQLLGCGGDGHA